ncbi:YppG-like protein [Evansella caseinilytica]|uniref:YppG-like protein n=1 Tax=Evansella caseinilytica TaxID=1503961 RepID=A0A1H3MS23_9BACI|nr:YppG family protein [Evansella caseinilytica]SDY79290.1 YppG-like protein [Evansella caseinilytica]
MYFPPNHGRQYRPPQAAYHSYPQGMYGPPQQPPAHYWQPPGTSPGQPYNANPEGTTPPQPAQRPASSILSAFKTKDGKFDFNKASTTIDQVVKVGNQISPIIKQVGGLFSSKN